MICVACSHPYSAQSYVHLSTQPIVLLLRQVGYGLVFLMNTKA